MALPSRARKRNLGWACRVHCGIFQHSTLIDMLRVARSSTRVFSGLPFEQTASKSKNLPLSLRRWNATVSNNDQDELVRKYSDTVFLPTTQFGNRSDQKLIDTVLKPQTMHELYHWNINRPLKDKNINNLFVFHDGPPYANGNLHIGHALNKVLKDIINRYELLKGKKVHYVPGWDCHGLPIELKTLEKLGKERKELEKQLKKQLKKAKDDAEKDAISQKLHELKHSKLSPTDIVRLATEHASATQKSQSTEFQELGIMGDFENPYMTLHKPYVVDQLRIFKKFFDNGLVHRQEKPVYWGCENATALAEGELEYNQQHQSKAAYVKFPLALIKESLKEKLGQSIVDQGLSALIWTSTPWTLASNLAISINEEFTYTIVKTANHGNLIVSMDLLENLRRIFEFEETGITFAGADLIGCEYKSDILKNGETYPFLHGSHVTSGAGTGLVHTAPGHGQDDYLVCLKNGIKPYSPVDKYGKYTNEVADSLKDFVGLRVLTDGNTKMIEKIDNLGVLVYLDENYIHSYPYDWRSKKPIIIRATPQWFIDVSKIKDLTIKALSGRVNFHPERGVNRLTSFIRTRNEWCISRQRSWGVPIPVLYHRETGEALLNDDIIERIIEVIESENIDGWFKQVEDSKGDISKWLPEKYQHLAKDYVLGTDTMDVWFDSGSSWKTIERYLKEENVYDQAEKRGYLADIYLEGSDQHRGWFQSSVLTKVGTSELQKVTGDDVMLPYRNIVTHGFTLDEKGEKMSKSIGNTIAPADILHGNKQTGIPKIGIDGLRLWVAQSDYTSDINVGPTILKHVGDNIKKMRFTFKFLLGNLNGFEGGKQAGVTYEKMNPLDQYILSKLYNLNQECLREYENHNFFKVVKNVNHFVNVDLSSIYFDVRKDSLYTDSLNSAKRVSTLSVFEEILQVLVSILAPVMPIMMQELWNNMPQRLRIGSEEKVFASPFHRGWYDANFSDYMRLNEEAENSFGSVLKLKDEVNLQITALRKEKTIKSGLETEVILSSACDAVAKFTLEDLADYLVVSSVNVGTAATADVVVLRSEKGKCPRCWKHAVPLGKEGLCVRCDSVVHS